MVRVIRWERFFFSAVALVWLSALGIGAWAIMDEVTEPKAGIVVDKAYYPPDDLLIPVYTTCGQGCSSMIIIPVHVDECWALYLKDVDEVGDVCVGKQTWDQTAEGVWFG